MSPPPPTTRSLAGQYEIAVFFAAAAWVEYASGLISPVTALAGEATARATAAVAIAVMSIRATEVRSSRVWFMDATLSRTPRLGISGSSPVARALALEPEDVVHPGLLGGWE